MRLPAGPVVLSRCYSTGLPPECNLLLDFNTARHQRDAGGHCTAPLAEAEQMFTGKRYVINTLINTFVHETLLARARWVRFAQDFTGNWQDLDPDKERLAQARDHYASLVAALDEELGA